MKQHRKFLILSVLSLAVALPAMADSVVAKPQEEKNPTPKEMIRQAKEDVKKLREEIASLRQRNANLTGKVKSLTDSLSADSTSKARELAMLTASVNSLSATINGDSQLNKLWLKAINDAMRDSLEKQVVPEVKEYLARPFSQMEVAQLQQFSNELAAVTDSRVITSTRADISKAIADKEAYEEWKSLLQRPYDQKPVNKAMNSLVEKVKKWNKEQHDEAMELGYLLYDYDLAWGAMIHLYNLVTECKKKNAADFPEGVEATAVQKKLCERGLSKVFSAFEKDGEFEKEGDLIEANPYLMEFRGAYRKSVFESPLALSDNERKIGEFLQKRNPKKK